MWLSYPSSFPKTCYEILFGKTSLSSVPSYFYPKFLFLREM